MFKLPLHVVLIGFLVVPLAGCDLVTKEEFAVRTQQLTNLQSDIGSTNSQIENNAKIIRQIQEQIDGLKQRTSQEYAQLSKSIQDLSQVSRDEDKMLRLTVESEAKDRKGTDQKLSEAIGNASADQERFRRVLQGLLQAEKELLISFVEIEQTIEALKKKGTITDKDIQTSKTVLLEAEVWAKRLESIKTQLDSLTKPQTPHESTGDK